MPRTRLVLLAAGRQPFQRELADRLQHRVPRLSVRLLHPLEQAVVAKRLDRVEDGGGEGARGQGGKELVLFALPPGPLCPLAPYALARLQREAADEDAQAAEEHLLLGGEE